MTSPSDKIYSSGRSPKTKREATSCRERRRRLALDALEPRTLMSVLPPPQIITRTDVSNTPGSEDTAPSISVDPLDPLRAVAVWTHAANPLEQNPLPSQYNSLGEGAYTTDGGLNWAKFSADTIQGFTYGLPSPLPNPANGTPSPISQYSDVTDLTVGFDRQHNVFVLESQHSHDFKSGSLVLQKYGFSGATPNLTLANKIVHQWIANPNQAADFGDQAHNPTLAVDTNVGNGQTNEPTGSPSAIVTGPDGNTYVAIQDQNQIQQLQGSSGLFTTVFASGVGFYGPNQLAFNPQDGDLYVSNSQNAEVLRVDGATGKSLGTFTQGLVTPKSPRDMVISPVDGNLLVSSKDTGSVLRYNAKTGAFLGSFVAPNSGNLQKPEGLAFGADGNLYVGDASNNSVLQYNGTTGTFLSIFVTPAANGGLKGPRGMVFGPDKNLYVVSQVTNQVLEFDRNTGGSLGVFASATGGQNDLNSPTSLVFSPIDGNLLVTSFTAGTPDKSEILRYNGATGVFISSFLAPPLGGLDRPTGITFRLNAASGHDEIIVGSEKTNTILRFDAHTGVYLGPLVPEGSKTVTSFDSKSGTYVTTIVPVGSGSLQDPTGFAFAGDTSLFVSSGNDNELLHYTSDGSFLASITPEPLNAPTDAVLGIDGYLYAVSRDTDSVARYDSKSGKFLGTFVASGAGGLNVPSALAFTPDHASLLVASSFDSSILKYSATTGAFQGVFVASTKATNGNLNDPEGLVFQNGNLFVTSVKSYTVPGVSPAPDTIIASGVVLEYNGATGAFIKPYTPEPMLAPEAAVIGLDGNLYVSSSISNEVIKYDGKTGRYISVFVPADPSLNGGLTDPRGIVFDSTLGEMFVSSYGTNRVLKYNASTGAYLGLVSTEPLQAPQGAVFSNDAKTFYVASRDTNAVLQYDATTGKFLGEFVSPNPALNGGLTQPVGLVFDAAGNLYVSSRGTNQVLRYTKTGAFDTVFASSSAGSGGPDLIQPEYLAFDTSSRLYVGTIGTDEVLRFNSDGTPAPALGNPGAEFVAPGQFGLNGPEGLVFDAASNLYVASSFTNQVLKYNTSGGTVGVFVADTTQNIGAQTGVFNPVGLAFHNPAGTNYLYVSGGTGDRSFVQIYKAADGKFVESAVLPGDGGLSGPTSLVFSPVDGSLLISNTATSTVLKFTGLLGTDVGGSFTPPTLPTPDGLTLDPTNSTLYVLSHDGGRLFKYAFTGATADFAGFQDAEPLNKPQDAVASPTDATHFYVASQGGDEILRYNDDGSFDKVFIPQGAYGIRNPKGLAFDSTGDLFVVSQGIGQIQPAIYEFDSTGKFLKIVVSAVAPPTTGLPSVYDVLNPPVITGATPLYDGIAIDAGGFLFVADAANNVVLRYDNKGLPAPSGTNTGAIFLTGLSIPSGLAITGTTLTVVNSGNGQVITYNESTATTILTIINDNKNLNLAGREVLGTDGNVYVTSPGLHEVARFKPVVPLNGTYLFDVALPMPIASTTPTGLLLLGTNLVVGDLENQIVLNYPIGSVPLVLSRFTTEPLIAPEDLTFAANGTSLLVTNAGSGDILNYDTTGTTSARFTFTPTPQGIAIGPVDGNVYVSDVADNEVLRYDGKTGAFIDIFVRSGAGGLRAPQGLAFVKNVDLLGNGVLGDGLLVVSRDTGQVLLYNPNTGAFIREFTPEPLRDPQGLTFDGGGDLYVASHGSDRVLQYDTTGNYLSKFTSDDLFAPRGAVLGPDGNLYVASHDTNEVIRYYGPGAAAGKAGTFKDVFVRTGVGGLIAPTGLVFGTDGNLYVASSGSNEVLRYVGGTGAYIGVFVKNVVGAAGSPNPQALTIDASGNLYVSTGNEVQEYRASSGAYIGAFVTAGSGGLSQAEGIAFSDTIGSGKPQFYVSSFATNQVLQYDGANGAFKKIYVQSGTSSANNLAGPTGIAFAADETLYVASSVNSEVIRYQAGTGSFLDVYVTTNRGGLSTPEAVVIDSKSNQILVTSSDTGQVLSYSLSKGTFNGPFTPGPLVAPTRVAFGPDGNLYVSSEGYEAKLFDPKPNVLSSVIKYEGGTGRSLANYVAGGSGGLLAANGLVFTADGSLLVSSRDSDTILRYNPVTGLTNDSFQTVQPVGPTFETFNPSDGLIYVSSTMSNSVLRYDPSTGKLLGTFIPTDPKLNGGLVQPQGLVFGPDGNLYVAGQDKFGNAVVIRYNGKTGQFIDTFVPGGYANLNQALGLTFYQGDLYVASFGNDRVIRYSGQNGSYLADYVAAGSGGLSGPTIVAFDAAGYLYVGSSTGSITPGPLPGPGSQLPDSILRYKPGTGNFDSVFVAPGTGGLDGPTAIAFDATGNFYVTSAPRGSSFITPQDSSDTQGDNRVLKFSPTGAYLGAFISKGAGGLAGPAGLAFDGAGNLIVSSRDNNELLKFSSTGNFIAKLDATPAIAAVAIAPLVPDGQGGLAVGDVNGDGILDVFASVTDLDSIQVYDGHTGEYLRTFVPSRLGSLSAPKDLIFSADGKFLYVSSSGNDRVNVYDAVSGAFVKSFSGGGLVGPDGLIIKNGVLYVAGTGSNSVVGYTLLNGSVVFKISSGLTAPKGLAFDTAGELLVTNSGGGNVLRFDIVSGTNLGVYNHSSSPGFTDPSSNKSQNDAFSNNVYVSWATNELGDSHAATVDQVAAIVLTQSSDGGGSFSPPQVLNDSRFSSPTELDAAPRLSISQGRLPGTLSVSDPGVPAGQVNAVWTDFGTNDFRTLPIPPTDAIVTDHAQAGVSYSATTTYTATDQNSAIATDPLGPHTTVFPLSVDVSDPRFTSLSHVAVRLSLIHPKNNTLQIDLVGPDGTRVPLVAQGNALKANFGLQPLDPANSNGPFTIDTVFDDQAPRDITNTLYSAPYTGSYRPDDTVTINLDGKVLPYIDANGKLVPNPGLSAFNGLTRASANGIWKLEITDFSSSKTATIQTQRVLDWGLDLSSNLTDSKDVTIVAADKVTTRLERYNVKGIAYTGPLALSSNAKAPALPGDVYSGVDPAGIAPAPVLASDNTLGSYSPNQGRIYVAYVDAYIHNENPANSFQPGDDTNIYLKYSDDGGLTWKGDPKLGNGDPKLVNDDKGTTDGFSEADISGGVDYGRPQFEPSIAVDASTGTLALSFYDTRYDPQHARTAMFVATSIDGGTTFAPETFVNAPQIVTDGITGLPVTLGPIPDNQSLGVPLPWFSNGTGDNKGPGYGASQGLAFVGGHLYPAWASNQNRGPSGGDLLDIRVVSATVASGPRIVSSTMGPVAAQTVHALDGTPLTFNSKTASGMAGVADGTPLADGFVVTFDRAVDPATLNPATTPAHPIARVIYRGVTTSGFSPGVDVLVNPVITPLMEGNTTQGPTEFLVRFLPQGKTGTYSYQVGPAIRDTIRTVTAGGAVVTGNLMDQNGNAIGGEDPRATLIIETTPGDLYTTPQTSSTVATDYSVNGVVPPFDHTTLPLIVSGPHIISTFVPGSVKTPDNLVTDQTVSQIAVTFDRDMDASTLTGAAVLRVVGTQGIIPGPYTITPQTGQGIHLRTFLIGFPVQQLSGTYLATLASTVKSITGEALDTNQNAGLDVLRGDPSNGTTIVTFKSADASPPIIGGPVAGRVTTSIINVPDSFIVQNVTLTINITYPFDPDLKAVLIAPNGTSVQLFDGVGQTGLQANFTNTTFDDKASTPIQNGGPPFFGTFEPQFPLGTFEPDPAHNRATPSFGNWTLKITDNGSGRTGTIDSWALNLTKPIPATGLGDPVADQATVSFRIFTQNPSNLLSSNTFTAVGPAGIGAKGEGLNAEISGRIGAIAIDPSDPSGNTVYVAASSGGIWKTQNFLTTSPSGPTYVPLTDAGPTFGMNVGSIAVFARNNDPNQSIIIAATGDPDSLGVETPGLGVNGSPTRGDSPSLTARGIGFLRSMDGGATWVLLDSTSNFDATGGLLPLNSGGRDHMFVGTAGFKVVVDPKLTPDGQVIIYAALSDVDVNGQALTGPGRAGGIWRSVDTGKTWTKQRAGQATDVIVDLASGTGATGGNLQILYAAFKGEGVFRSPNRGQEFDLMTGTTGNPLIQNFDLTPTQPVGVLPAKASPYNGLTNPNSAQGRIVLARPAVTGNPLEDVLYQGWLYAAVVSRPSVVTADNQLVAGGHLAGLYLTKDLGQNWTRVLLPAFGGGTSIVPSTDDRQGEFDPLGNSTPYGVPVPHPPDLNNFGTGNFNISLAVDPNNPNVVYLGGTSQFSPVGLMRIDTTGIADPHAFYQSQTDPEGKLKTIAAYGLNGERSIWVGWPIVNGLPSEIHGPTVESNPGQPLNPDPKAPFDPAYTPYLNLIANPRNPFLTASTIPVTNTLAFNNSGAKAKWTAFDYALKPDTFATNPTDPWASPTRGVHRIITSIDPQTGKTRLIFGDDNGIFTVVDSGDGTLVGSLGSVSSITSNQGDVTIATGSRNGNLQTAELYYGASEPSTAAAAASLLKGLFYGSTDNGGTPYSNANVISPGQTGYGDITWARPYVERASGAGIAAVQTGPTYADFGSFYRYVLPSEMDNLTGLNHSTTTDFLQSDLTSRTFNLLQNQTGQFDPAAGVQIFDITDGQWPFRQGFNFTVNPLSGEQLLISSDLGRVFSTENSGKFWNLIGNATALDSSNAQALAYGAPDVNNANLGNLDSFVYAGTIKGNIFVTFNGGGTNGNQWTPLSQGLDGSAIQQIITNPTRTSHEAYAVTQKGVYHMVDSKLSNAAWVNITGNLFSITSTLFNDPAQVQARLRNLTTIQADWRYIIPDNFNLPTGTTHPMLYVGGEGGIFRSLDNGGTWSFYPSADPSGTDVTPTPPGDGGGLPNALVTDMHVVLGNIDPTNGRPNIATGPNTLLATTFGRGAFTIRLAPTVFPDTKANPSALHLSQTMPLLPPPGGSDTGLSNSDQITNLTQPFIEGLSEQSAFGSSVTVSLYDMTDGTKAPIFIGAGQTDAAGKFSIQVNAGVYKSDGSTDGVKLIGIQATDQSNTKGNIAKFTFTLDTIAPIKPTTPVLDPANDTGRSNSDGVTMATKPIIDLAGIEATAQVFLYRDGGAKAVATRIGNGTVQDAGPLADGIHTYVAIQEDVAGNFSIASDTLVITVDTTPPFAPIAPTLDSASDSGLFNSDDYTNVTKPFIDLVATETTAQIILLRKLASDPPSKFAPIGSTIGSGSVQDLGPLADGVYNYAAQQIDLAGNVGLIGPSLTVTIDTVGEGPATVPDLEAGSDTGISNSDNITSNTKPFFDITAVVAPAEPVSKIELLRKLVSAPSTSYQVVGTALTTATNPNVTIQDPGPLADGVYDYASIQIDLAGNTGPRSAPLVVTIDTTPALSPLALVLDSKSDTGSSNNDQITNAAAPFFDVTTGEANDTVQLFRKALGNPDSSYIAVGTPITVPVQGTGLLQDPVAPANGVFVYSVQATDAAGNTGSLGLVTTIVTFDNIPPVAPVAPVLAASSDTGISNSDDITNSTTPVFNVLATENTATVQLLRKVKGAADTSYKVVGSIIGSGAVADTKLPVPKPDAVYTYATRQVDLAGNVGAIGGTLNVTIDTTPPSVPTLVLDPRDDTGVQGDNTTSILRPRLSGSTEPGAFLVLAFTTGAPLATGVAATDGTFNLVPNQDLSPDGVYHILVNASDVAGNVSTSPTLTLTIDTTAPGTPPAPQLDPASDSGQSNTDGITNIKNPFLLVASTETTATVQLYRKKLGDPDALYALVGQIIGGGKIQDTAALNLPDGSYVYDAKQIDEAGNVGSFGPTLIVVYDTTAPVAAPIPQLDRSTDSGVVGDGITNFKSNRVFNLIATEPTDNVQLFRKLFSSPDTAYLLVGQVVGSGQVTDSTILPDTKYAYAANQIDLAGNVGPIGPAQAITISTQPPTSPTLNLLSADDTGSKGDGITSVKRPHFTGITQPGALVELLSSGSVIASTTADATNGTYSVQPLSDFFDGTYTIQTRATDVAANSALSLSTINLTIDTVPPAVPTLSILPADDTGLAGDGITSVRRPHLIGTTDPKAKVELLDGLGIVRASTFADATTGAFSLQPPLDLADGKYTFQARASDVAANLATSSPLNIQIVQVAPTTPTVALLPADDSGIKGDSITNVNRPHLVGTAGPNVSITLVDGSGKVYGTTMTDATGAFAVQPVSPLADGTYAFKVLAPDAQGNAVPSNAIALTIDTVAPIPPSLTILAADDTGIKGDFVTEVRRPRLVGTSAPNGVAALYGSDGKLYSAVITAADGSFTLQSIYDLKLGVNNFTVQTSDAAGNVSVRGVVPAITLVKTSADYDGDGKSDIAIYDAVTATFYIQYSSGGSKVFSLGNANGQGIPVSGDFDGDGKTDVAVYDPVTASYFVAYSSGGIRVFQFGIPNHRNIAVPGDFDGDGKTDIAVYDQIDGKFYILYSASGVLAQVSFGPKNNRDLPVAGDYNGDGRTDLALYDPVAAAFSVVYTDGSGGFVRQFGRPNGGDLPIAADFDGDGKTDLAVYDPGPAYFYELYSNPLFQGGSKVYQYGVPNGQGIPVSADYDGDGRTDTTVFDPVSATFYATFSAGSSKVTQFGPTGHRVIPIPAIAGPALVGASSLNGNGNGADFTPIAPPQATAADTTVLGYSFGHPDQVKKFALPANRVRKSIVNLARHGLKVAAVKTTAHDLALESLWSDAPGA